VGGPRAPTRSVTLLGFLGGCPRSMPPGVGGKNYHRTALNAVRPKQKWEPRIQTEKGGFALHGKNGRPKLWTTPEKEGRSPVAPGQTNSKQAAGSFRATTREEKCARNRHPHQARPSVVDEISSTMTRILFGSGAEGQINHRNKQNNTNFSNTRLPATRNVPPRKPRPATGGA